MTKSTEATPLFSKILVARHSPKNACWAQDGELLVPLPVPSVESVSPGDAFSFAAVRDLSILSRFGWVSNSPEPFTLTAFSKKNLNFEPSEREYDLMTRMFSVISNLPVDTPIAGSFFRRGVERPEIILDFHKVFFQRGKNI